MESLVHVAAEDPNESSEGKRNGSARADRDDSSQDRAIEDPGTS